MAECGLYLQGGPRASTPGGQLQTMPEHHPNTFTSHTLKSQTHQPLESHTHIFQPRPTKMHILAVLMSQHNAISRVCGDVCVNKSVLPVV